MTVTVRFAGYAAIFDHPDRGGDIIRKGAFDGAKAGLPVFWCHDATRRIGTVYNSGEANSVKGDEYLSLANAVPFLDIYRLYNTTVGALYDLNAPRRNNLARCSADLINLRKTCPADEACQSSRCKHDHTPRRSHLKHATHCSTPSSRLQGCHLDFCRWWGEACPKLS